MYERSIHCVGEEGYNLLDTVEIFGRLVALPCKRLEVFPKSRSELLLKTVTVEAEKTLKSIGVSLNCVCECQLLEVEVHGTVVVLSKVHRPEAEESVHLSRLTDT